MTREDKELLFRDLCARLPYGVKVYFKGKISLLFSISPTQGFPITLDKTPTKGGGLINVSEEEIGEVKPYLRPMESMTEEEKREFYDCVTFEHTDGFAIDECCGSNQMLEKFDWLKANHFDYRGLIPKGRAIEVTEDNNPYKV